MIRVNVTKGQSVEVRSAQLVGAAPGQRNYWAYTCDDQPKAWLIVHEDRDKMTGKPSYSGIYR